MDFHAFELRVEELFKQARDLPLVAQAKFLEDACRDDPTSIQQHLELLLAADQRLRHAAASGQSLDYDDTFALHPEQDREFARELHSPVRTTAERTPIEGEPLPNDTQTVFDEGTSLAQQLQAHCQLHEPTTNWNAAARHNMVPIENSHALRPADMVDNFLRQVLLRYDLIEQAGRGGMGIVYKARHRLLDKTVALKVILPGIPFERFLREAQLLAKVNSPHVVTVYDFDQLADGSAVLAMEWVDGGNLAGVISQCTGPIDECQTLSWMRDVCNGMATAAAAGIVHRDLKPANILIGSDGRAMVADFGLARGQNNLGDLSLAGQVMGTPLYMAPEQADDPKLVDTRSDIYSFGATFYHALTGRPPFTGETVFAILYKHKVEPLISPRAHNLDIAARVSDVLERCLAKSPSDRFASFEDLLKHLQTDPQIRSPWESVDDGELAVHLERFYRERELYFQHSAPWSAPFIYRFPGTRTLEISRGDITEQRVDAIVSSDDDHLTMGGGVSEAICRAGGGAIESEARNYVPVRPGRAVVTSGGILPARFVFHGVTIRYRAGSVEFPSRDIISEIMASCFYHADTLSVRTIAFPLLGAGTGKLTRDVCLDTMFRFLARKLINGATSVQTARIVLRG